MLNCYNFSLASFCSVSKLFYYEGKNLFTQSAEIQTTSEIYEKKNLPALSPITWLSNKQSDLCVPYTTVFFLSCKQDVLNQWPTHSRWGDNSALPFLLNQETLWAFTGHLTTWLSTRCDYPTRSNTGTRHLSNKRGACGVTVIGVGNSHSDSNQNPRLDCFQF